MNWFDNHRVTASAYSQARYKLKHTAFIELNQKAVVDTMYEDDGYKKFLGFRVLAVDGLIRLPDNDDIREEFGTIAYTNGKDSIEEGEHPYALASVLYDVLNRLTLTAELARFDAYEAEAVRQDFFSTLYLSGLETILTEPAQNELDQKETQHPQIVNRAVSFNAITDQALDLLFLGELKSDVLLNRLTALFLTNPCLERKGRSPPRKKASSRALLDFHKWRKKHCY